MPASSPLRRAASTGTRNRLVDAATDLFLQHGYEATSVRLIAKEAAVTIGAVYGHFESKRSVLLAVVRSINVNSGHSASRFSARNERALLLTVASFAHTDEEASAVLGEVLRGAGNTGTSQIGTLSAVQVGELVTNLAR